MKGSLCHPNSLDQNRYRKRRTVACHLHTNKAWCSGDIFTRKDIMNTRGARTDPCGWNTLVLQNKVIGSIIVNDWTRSFSEGWYDFLNRWLWHWLKHRNTYISRLVVKCIWGGLFNCLLRQFSEESIDWTIPVEIYEERGIWYNLLFLLSPCIYELKRWLLVRESIQDFSFINMFIISQYSSPVSINSQLRSSQELLSFMTPYFGHFFICVVPR